MKRNCNKSNLNKFEVNQKNNHSTQFQGIRLTSRMKSLRTNWKFLKAIYKCEALKDFNGNKICVQKICGFQQKKSDFDTFRNKFEQKWLAKYCRKSKTTTKNSNKKIVNKINHEKSEKTKKRISNDDVITDDPVVVIENGIFFCFQLEILKFINKIFLDDLEPLIETSEVNSNAENKDIQVNGSSYINDNNKQFKESKK